MALIPVNQEYHYMPQPKITRHDTNRPSNIDDEDLLKQCRLFLKTAVPESNIILEGEFDKFLILFNKKGINSMQHDERIALQNEYSSRFSLQHPIQIISNTLDPNGVLYVRDHMRHRLVRTIPPMFHRVRTLNEFSKDGHVLMTELFNAVNTKGGNPLDHRDSDYSKIINEVLKANHKKDTTRTEQVKEFAEAEKKLKGSQNPEKKLEKEEKKEEESCSTGMFDWG